MLFFINPMITLLALFIFGAIYLIIIKGTGAKLQDDGELIATKSTKVIKILQEGLGGFREIFLDRSQEKYCEVFKAEDLSLRKAQASNLFISQSPRYIVEALGITLVACVAYFFSSDKNGVVVAIPLLGAFALAAQRLLPILQQLFSSWTNIQASKTSLNDVLLALNQPLPRGAAGNKKIVFERLIQLKDAWFRYGVNQSWVLKGVDISISKGDRIGVIGQSGGGKSTLIDILMGLLTSERGQLVVDGQLIDSENVAFWQSLIAHVPQSIYLADRSIAENIAFNVPGEKIDMDLVRYCATQAQLSKAIESWSDGYESQVGERGVRLSGGQRQRIGIARALYKNAKIIMLDEATSALDGGTEDSVMQVIENLNPELTVVIVAHRLSTLRKCSTIIKIEDGIAVNVPGL
jgi:ATP-binding cassette subfamily B protein